MENKLMEYLISKELEQRDLNQKSCDILSKYANENGLIATDKMSVNDTIEYNTISEFKKSNAFKLGCMYELFPNFLSKEETFVPPYNSNEEFKILPDARHITGKCFQIIAGEAMEWSDGMTNKAYKEQFNKKMKHLLETGKITQEMIVDCQQNYKSTLEMKVQEIEERNNAQTQVR